MTEPEIQIDLSQLFTKGTLPKFLTFMYYPFVERALWTFAKLSIADQMVAHKLPLTAVELSQLNNNNWNINLVYRVLRMMADLNVVKTLPANDGDDDININLEHKKRFQLSDSGLYLTSDHPSKARDVILMTLGPIMQKSTFFLPDLIRNGYKNGDGFELANGSKLFDYCNTPENEEFSLIFQNAMLSSSILHAPAVVSALDFSRFEKLVDVGGGIGTFLALLLRKNEKLHGVLFDLPYAIELVKAKSPNDFERNKIDPRRFEFVSGDMFQSETIPQADSYVLKKVLHDWNDEKCIEILKSIRHANKSCPEKLLTIFIVELVDLSDDGENWVVRASDMVMLMVTSAKERTIHGYKQLLKRSGYEFKQLYRTRGPYSVIEATTTASVTD
jgi:hypothetical protein